MNERLRAKLAILLAAIFYTSNTILSKRLSANFSGMFLTLSDFTVCIILVTLSYLVRRKRPEIKDAGYLVLRGILGAIATILFFVAVKMGDGGRATLMNFTFPLFAALFGFLFFKEKLSVFHLISLALCLGGLLFVFNDGNRTSVLADVVGILSGFMAGLTVHYIKKSRTNNDPVMVFLALCVFGFVGSLPAAGEIVKVTPQVLLLLAGKGAVFFTAQVLSTYSYKFLTATTASIMSYINIPLTLVMSLLINHEIMNGRFVTGAALIIAGLLIATLTRGDQPQEAVSKSEALPDE